MSTVRKFEDMQIWQESRILVNEIYILFSESKNYAFKDQIYKASLSVMNNIAEGFDRYSDKEFVKFLFYATASCSEVRSMLYIAMDQNYLPAEKAQNLQQKCTLISKQISSLIKYLKK